MGTVVAIMGAVLSQLPYTVTNGRFCNFLLVMCAQVFASAQNPLKTTQNCNGDSTAPIMATMVPKVKVKRYWAHKFVLIKWTYFYPKPYSWRSRKQTKASFDTYWVSCHQGEPKIYPRVETRRAVRQNRCTIETLQEPGYISVQGECREMLIFQKWAGCGSM